MDFTPSIPPERLFKAQLVIALYPVRPDRQFCEQLDYNLFFRWFLDLCLESGELDQSNFSRLRERPMETHVARRFFDEVARLARKDKLRSSDHVTVDGALIEAWAASRRSAVVARGQLHNHRQVGLLCASRQSAQHHRVDHLLT